MKRIWSLFSLFLLLGSSTHTQAADCKNNTAARLLIKDKQVLSQQILDKKSGQYIANFRNGDLLIASFSRCGPGFNAHYYSRRAFDNNQEKARKLNWMASLVLPNQQVLSDLKEQLASVNFHAENRPIVLSHQMDNHNFRFVSEESSLFPDAIHYLWQPPEF